MSSVFPSFLFCVGIGAGLGCAVSIQSQLVQQTAAIKQLDVDLVKVIEDNPPIVIMAEPNAATVPLSIPKVKS
jgi:hypothetical protein